MNGHATITIGSKPVGLFFGYSGHKSFITGLAKFNKQFFDDETGLTQLGLASILLSAYENNCFNERITPVLTIDDFLQYTDEYEEVPDGAKEFENALKEWSASQPVQKMIEKSGSSAEKKSSQETISELDTTSTKSSGSVSESSLSSPGSSENGPSGS